MTDLSGAPLGGGPVNGINFGDDGGDLIQAQDNAMANMFKSAEEQDQFLNFFMNLQNKQQANNNASIPIDNRVTANGSNRDYSDVKKDVNGDQGIESNPFGGNSIL